MLTDMEGMRQAEAADHIKSLMFAFEDLGRVDDRGIQELLRHIDCTDLAMALKGAPRDIVLLFAGNMSKRARAAVLTIAEQLTEAGGIVIADDGDQYVS